MDVNSLPETVTRQRRDCDLNPGPSVPESSTLTTRLPSLTVGLPPQKRHICAGVTVSSYSHSPCSATSKDRIPQLITHVLSI